MSKYPDLPFVQAKNYGPARTQTQMVVIHATDNTASAENEAAYASRRTDGVSSHFYTDNDSTVQSLDTLRVAYGCYPTGNSRSVQFELCGRSNQLSDATLRQAAPIVARACKEFGLPIQKVSAEQLRNGIKGICGHWDVTQAWGEGNHTDPGANFPWATFIGYVQAAAGGGGGDDMPFATGPTKLPVGPGTLESYSIPPVNSGGLPWGAAYLSIFTDLFGGKAKFRIVQSDGNGVWTFLGTKAAPTEDPTVVVESGKIFNVQLKTGTRGLSVQRLAVDENDKALGSVSFSIEYGSR